MACVEINITDVLHCPDDTANLAGTGQYLDYILTNDLSGEPSIPVIDPLVPVLPGPGPTNIFERSVTASGVFLPKATKGFTRVQMLPYEGELDISTVGSAGRLSFDSKFTIKLPFTRLAYGFAVKMVNQACVLGIARANSDKLIVGSRDFPAQFESVKVTNNDTDSVIEIVVKQGKKAAYYFDGTIPYKP